MSLLPKCIFYMHEEIGYNPFGKVEHGRLVEYRAKVAELEREFLYGARQLPPDVETTAKRIMERSPGVEHHELGYYIGAAWHEIANVHQMQYLDSLRDVSLSEKTGAVQATPDDIHAYYMTHPERQLLEGMEDRALEAYTKAKRGHWSTPFRASQLNAAILCLDLEDRIAARRLDGDARDQKRKANLHVLRRIIENLPLGGARSELSFMYVMRFWMAEMGISHVASIEHGLPREDMGEKKIDVRLLLGSRNIPLQLKTEVKDNAYLKEHYERVRRITAERIGDHETILVTLDTLALNEVYRLVVNPPETKGEKQMATRLKNKILDSVIQALPEEDAVIMKGLFLKQRPEKTPTPERITRDFLFKHSDVRHLQALGLLDDGAGSTAVIQAKSVLFDSVPELARIFKTRAAYVKLDGDMAAIREIFRKKILQLKGGISEMN